MKPSLVVVLLSFIVVACASEPPDLMGAFRTAYGEPCNLTADRVEFCVLNKPDAGPRLPSTDGGIAPCTIGICELLWSCPLDANGQPIRNACSYKLAIVP